MEKYFVTGDLEKTLTGGVDFLKGDYFKISDDIRNSLKDILNESFNKNIVEYIGYEKIKSYFLELNKESEFIISLEDGIYIDNADFYFSSTRTYNSQDSILNDPNDYKILQRNGLKLDYQKEDLILETGLSKKKEFILCDDGLFSGDTFRDVISMLKSVNIKIKEIRVILNFTGKNDLDGIPIVSMYKENNCIDWLDERDLFYGTKNGGASFFQGTTLNGLPYISNTKVASKKASIPEESSKLFCDSMIDLNKQVWKELEKNKSKLIRLANLPRIGYLLNSYDRNLSIGEILELEKDRINID